MRAALLGVVALVSVVGVLSVVALRRIADVILTGRALAIRPLLHLHAFRARLPGAASRIIGVMLAGAATFGGVALAVARVFLILVVATMMVMVPALFRKLSVVGARRAVAVAVNGLVVASSRHSHLLAL